jgi:hypothetical protein
MRIYIIGNDGITLCREPPAAVDEGEISVASSAELHAARLSGKRLLALWNALPGVEKRRKVADRDALIEQLWSAIEMLPDPQSDAKRPSKQEEVVAMLRRAVLEQIAKPDASGLSLLRDAAEAMRLSARGYHRVLRVWRARLPTSTAPTRSAACISPRRCPTGR